MFEQLFNPKTIEKEIQKLTISQKQKDRANEWLAMINDGTLEKEETNYKRFENILLRDILNFPEKEIEKGFEIKNVEYSFNDDEKKTFVCFEAKGTKTKKLFARQSGRTKDQETPVIQTITDMSRFASDYGVCTNYNNFVLVTKEYGQEQCHRFNFNEIANNDDKLKEFILIFSYDNLKTRFVNIIREKSVTQNEQFTEEFYDVFHETRLMLIKAFEEKQDVDRKNAIKYSQIILNRLLFIFFTSDKTNISVPKDLFTNQITKLLKSDICSDNSRHVYNEIVQNLFGSFEKGSTSLGIFGFNGGLFAEKIPPEIYFYDLKDPDFFKDIKNKSIKISVNSKIQQILDANKGRVSPIIVNFLIMDAYDFEKEVNVRILGHVLEQSVSDIEHLQSSTVSRRKKEGIFYTPELITEFICKETILPYLSEKNSKTIHQLVTEYSENLNDLEDKIKSIKIIDPACGSGAFLIKAVEILLEIYHTMQEEKKLHGKYTAEVKRRKRSSTQKLATLDEQIDESRMNEIIENNIFGVDLSEESVGITKLSLFLKLSVVAKKLSDLSKNIKVGNSIIDDKSIDSGAFNWNQEFNNVFQNGGFDIVIGNPPYVRQELFKEIKPHLKSNFASYNSIADQFVYFVEQGISKLTKNGFFGFIIPNKFKVVNYGRELRTYLKDNTKLKLIYNFDEYPIFRDASTYTLILMLEKNQNPKPYDFTYAELKDMKSPHPFLDLKKSEIKINSDTLTPEPWNFSNPEEDKILKKIQTNSIPLKNIVSDKIFRGISSGKNAVFFIDQNTKNNLEKDLNAKKSIKKLVTGSAVKRFSIDFESEFLLFIPWEYDINYSESIKQYLSNNKAGLEKRPEVKEGRFNWWVLSRYGSTNSVYLSKPKIIYPRITNDCNFCLDESGEIFLSDNNFFISSDSKSLLAILNSKLVFFFLKHRCPTLRGGYYDFRRPYVEKIPVHKNWKKHDSDLENKSNIILDSKIKLYNYEKKFLNNVNSTFNPKKIPKNLQNFPNLEFNEFINEIKSVSSVKPTPKELDDWQEYFDEQKQNQSNLLSLIMKTEEEINSIVYDLYNLSKDEIMIIEKS